MRQLLASKKFIVMIAAVVMVIAGKLGLNLDPELVQQIVYLAIAFIVGQGIADHGKEAAKIEASSGVPVATMVTETSSTKEGSMAPTVTTRTIETTIKPVQAGFIDIGLVLASAILGIAIIGTSCHVMKDSVSSTKEEAVNCLGEHAQSLTKEFGPAVRAVVMDAFDPSTRQINWSPVKQVVWSLTKDSGMCVLANVVADMLDPPPVATGAPLSAPVDMDPRSLRSGFAEIAGGTRYATRRGLL